MKPLTLEDVNRGIAADNARLNGGTLELIGPWALYQSADQPYTGCLRMAFGNRPIPLPVSREIDRLADNLGAMPIGFAIARVNRILETIPEPDEEVARG